MKQVIIGVDPHKLSATIEVVDGNERLLGSGRFATDRAGYAAMRSYAKTPGPPLWNRLPRAVAGTGPGMDLILIPLVVTGAECTFDGVMRPRRPTSCSQKLARSR